MGENEVKKHGEVGINILASKSLIPKSRRNRRLEIEMYKGWLVTHSHNLNVQTQKK